MNNDALNFTLEILNGNWAVAAFCLGVACWIYIVHEWRSRPSRRVRWETWTLGMRTATWTSMIAAGVWITRFSIYVWDHEGGRFSDLQWALLVSGGLIGTVGFLGLIREISENLLGNLPWICTTVLMFAMTVYTVVVRIY